MRRKIVGAEVFSCATGNIVIPPVSNDYTVQYSANGVDFDDIENGTVPAGENGVVMMIPVGTFIRLNGNTDTVNILC